MLQQTAREFAAAVIPSDKGGTTGVTLTCKP